MNRAVNLKLDYAKYQAIAESDLAQEDKIAKILHYGKMYQKYFYRCNYKLGTIVTTL